MTALGARPQSIALFGGSFNPPHVGHVMIGAWVLATTDVDKLWVMPTWNHAFTKDLVNFDVRMDMCKAAFSTLEAGRIHVSDIERDLGGESRTIDTVEHIRDVLGIQDIRIVIGADILAERHLWKRWDDLERMCTVIIIGREGWNDPSELLSSPPLIDVSSTDLRNAVAQGTYPNTIPARVARIIRNNQLYA